MNQEQIKETYTKKVMERPTCCGGYASVISCGYTPEELRVIPEDAVISSFGCGNPLGVVDVKQNQVVIDIGSGAGIDCFLASQKVGVTGKVIGIDMTPKMI